MNTWRDIKADPPELNTPILATDGNRVLLGKVSTTGSVFTGVSLQDGTTSWMGLEDLTGWQPAPKYKPQKTAQQMFRELGYIKVSGRMYHREGRLYHTYITCLKTATTKVLYRKNGEVVLQATAMENKEILAVARLIEEMEVEK